jgi:hypothetical protein
MREPDFLSPRVPREMVAGASHGESAGSDTTDGVAWLLPLAVGVLVIVVLSILRVRSSARQAAQPLAGPSAGGPADVWS